MLKIILHLNSSKRRYHCKLPQYFYNNGHWVEIQTLGVGVLEYVFITEHLNFKLKSWFNQLFGYLPLALALSDHI